jgi:predicted ATPase
MAIKGYAAPEVVQAYARARELGQQVGEASQLIPVVWGLHRFHQARAELNTAHELGEQLLTLAYRTQDSAALMEAHRALGQTLLQIGNVSSARAHLEEGIALYDPLQHRSLAFLYGLDPQVACLTYAALALWWLGYPDQASGRIHEALTLAQELAHPYSLATALFWAAWIHQFRRETPAAQERAEAAIALATEQGFPLPMAFGAVIRGWALAVRGQGAEGVAQLRQSLAAWRATGGELHRPYFLGLLAEACENAGEIEEGLCALEEALTIVNHTGAHWWEAELHRLKGELLRQAAAGRRQRTAMAAEVEACFRQALNLPRCQQAKSLELRAAMSLSRLRQQQGKQAEARELLAPVYGWFTEGFDTADLQEAKALLAAMV